MIFLRSLLTESPMPYSIAGIGDIDVADTTKTKSRRSGDGVKGFELIIYRPVGGNNGKGSWLTGKNDEVFGYNESVHGNIILDREKLKRTLVITSHTGKEFSDIMIAVPYVLYITGEWSSVTVFSGNFVWSNDPRFRHLNGGHLISCHDRLS